MSWPILRWDSGCLSNRLHSMCKVDWPILRWDSCRSIYYSHPRTLSKVDWHYYGGILDASTTPLSKGSKITKISSCRPGLGMLRSSNLAVVYTNRSRRSPAAGRRPPAAVVVVVVDSVVVVVVVVVVVDSVALYYGGIFACDVSPAVRRTDRPFRGERSKPRRPTDRPTVRSKASGASPAVRPTDRPFRGERSEPRRSPSVRRRQVVIASLH